MTQLGALFFADWCVARNNVRRILRSPGRTALWVVYVIAIGVLAVSRFVGRQHVVTSDSSAGVGADYIVSALLITVIVAVATGRGAVGIFRSHAEARFIIGSPIAAPLAIAYLQARESLGQGVRFLVSLVYFFVVLDVRRIGLAATLIDIVLVLAIASAAAAIAVPRRLLPPRAGLICGLAGIPLGLLAIAPSLRDAVVQFGAPAAIAGPILSRIPDWHPGRILIVPNPEVFATVVALAALAIGVVAAAGRDVYPELYALAVARIERRERLRRRSTQRAKSRRGPAARLRIAPTAPSGVMIFVWKSIVEFRRVTSPALVFGGIAVIVGGGAILGHFSRDDDALFVSVSAVAVNVLLVVGVIAATALAGELRRPLFWLSPAAMFERLCALELAQIWRLIATLEIFGLGVALGGGGLVNVLIVAIAFPSLVALCGAVGFAAYAIFPSAIDARGPLVFVRFAVCLAALVPPLVLFGIGLGIAGSAYVAVLSSTVLALVEAGAFIGVAAWKLDGQTDRLASPG